MFSPHVTLTSYWQLQSRTPSHRATLTSLARVYKADAATCELYQLDPIIVVEMMPTGPFSNPAELRYYIRAEGKEENNNWLSVLSSWIDVRLTFGFIVLAHRLIFLTLAVCPQSTARRECVQEYGVSQDRH